MKLKTILCLISWIPLAFTSELPPNTLLSPTQDLKFHYSTEIISIDPQKIETVNDVHLANQLFEGLVSITPTGEITEGVATHWTHNDNFTQWTFYLRPTAKWSDGSNLTAHDFVYAWQRLANPKTASPYVSYLEFLKLENISEIIKGKMPIEKLGVKAIDEYTLQLNLSAPVPYIDLLVQNPSLFPAPQKIIEKYGEQWTIPEYIVSNGAYTLKQRIINEKIELKRNPHYWNNDKSIIDNATAFILENNSAFTHYRSNQLDISNIPANFYMNEKYKKEYEPQLYSNLQLATYRYEINLNKPPMNDLRVRQALNLSLDRELITEKVLGYSQPITFNFTPTYIYLGHKIKQPEYIKLSQSERNILAQNLLKQAGYSKDNPLIIELTHSHNKNNKNVVIASKALWEKNLAEMVKINLKSIEWKMLLEEKQQGNFQLITSSWFADYNEASTFLTFYHSKNHKNKTGFANSTFDKFLAESYFAKDNQKRAEIYALAEAELAKYQPFIAIYHYVDFFVKNPKLKGYDGKNPQGVFLIKDLYFVQ